MNRPCYVIFLFLLIQGICYGQNAWRDSTIYNLSITRDDKTRVELLVGLANYYKSQKPDSGLFFGHQALALARKIGFPEGEVKAMSMIGANCIGLGNDVKALEINLRAIKLVEKYNLFTQKAELHFGLGLIYMTLKNFTDAVKSFRKTMDLTRPARVYLDSGLYTYSQSKLSECYLQLDQPDSALHYAELAWTSAAKLGDRFDWVIHTALISLANLYEKNAKPASALKSLWQSLAIAGDAALLIQSNYSIAKLYKQLYQNDSAIYYAKKSLAISQVFGYHQNIIESNTLLSELYEKSDLQKAFDYNKVASELKDSLYNQGRSIAIENLTSFDEQERLYEIETARAAYQSRVKLYSLIGGLAVVGLIALVFYRNYKQKQNANKVLQGTLDNLKSAQSQLIQREKMASLGELTAGIAHEIQNPLNFVNNFSEVNKDLLAEMNDEIGKGNFDDVKAIAKDITDNQEKINHHGKRADAIVKGMLSHSRSSSGQKEPTDINALCDEYLKLAYHGMRAKTKSFNAMVITDFARDIGKINVVPQDLGRVVLNLINNAFYAVGEKAKLRAASYEPRVVVTTKKTGDKIEIKVRDNGDGIPEKIIDKIFQPFFTTKPTGQGTGLGLSLAYDAVKAHGGELKVETRENEGSEFVIQLPNNEIG